MLERLTVRGFKSLREVTIEPGRHLTVLFGPNAAGKSNLLEAAQVLSVMSRAPTLQEALGANSPVRGHTAECFSYPDEGLPALLKADRARPSFTLEAVLSTSEAAYEYRLSPRLDPRIGAIGVSDEYLAETRPDTKRFPNIRTRDGQILIRRKGSREPKRESLGARGSILSDRRYSGAGYEALDHLRREFERWRIYAVEPQFRMRAEQFPGDFLDIGVHGEFIGSYLYRMHAAKPKYYASVVRMLRQLVPGMDAFTLALNERRGNLDLLFRQDGVEYSSRIVSEGTLRILALCALTMNPWIEEGLVGIEEPENGVHPRRLEQIADLLLSFGEQQDRQVIVTTHSPLFVGRIVRAKRRSDDPDGIRLLQVGSEDDRTTVKPFDPPDALFEDERIAGALADRGEQGVVESLILRGILDA